MNQSEMVVVEHNSCRLCHSKELEELFSLGNQYINNFVPKELIGEGLKAPLDLVMCNNCSLIQLKHTAPQELLYSRFYWYRSGVTETMRNELKDITKAIENEVILKDGDVILDIGANDGTLLDSYSVKGLKRVGCEPADNLIESLSAKTDFVMHDFWTYEGYVKKQEKWSIGKASYTKTAWYSRYLYYNFK